MAVLTAATITFGIALYVAAGHAFWRLIDDAHARVMPEDHATCVLNADVARRDWLAISVKYSFVAIWPFFMTYGAFCALLSARQR